MKTIFSRMPQVIAIAIAACTGLTVDAQVVREATEPTYLATDSFGHVDVPSAAPSARRYDTRSFHRSHRASGPTIYYQAEAMFLSRQYDMADTEFGLGNASANLLGATWDIDGNFSSVAWGVQDDLSTTAILDDDFGRADQLTGSPRLTLGIVGDHGVGIQGRYWRMENPFSTFGLPVDFSNNPPYPPTNPIDGDWEAGGLNRVSGSERFSAETIDLELTKDFSFFGWNSLATFGARYGLYDNYRLNTADGGIATGAPGILAPPGSIDNLSNTYHTADYDLGSLQSGSFRGTGFTTSLTALRPFAFNPHFALFASARGSVLYGNSVNTAQTYAAVESFYNSDWQSNSSEVRTRNEQYITELQLGTQWSRNVRFLNGRMFARSSFEYQFWRNNVSQAVAQSSAGDLGITRGVTSASGDSSGIGRTEGYSFAQGLKQDFDMIGASFAAGFAF